jgi:hypothetical protein
VTLIQRFGSALNINLHFHILFLDGIYVYRDNRSPRFQRVKASDTNELEELVQLISKRVRRSLETTKKDRQSGQCKRDLSNPRGHPAINSCRAAGFWKETFSTRCRLLFLY